MIAFTFVVVQRLLVNCSVRISFCQTRDASVALVRDGSVKSFLADALGIWDWAAFLPRHL